MVFDYCVVVRSWEPDFKAPEVKINKTLVWIKFPNLSMECYDESILLALATAIGGPMRVDIRTMEASRGKFARMCVEVELDKPVVRKFWFRNRWFNVEYEGLHLLCKKCGLFGHIGKNCTSGKVAPADENTTANVVDSGGAAVEHDRVKTNSNLNSPNQNRDNSG